MNAFTLLRLFHSYWRWAVVILAVIVLVRAVAGVIGQGRWGHREDRLIRLFSSAFDLQVLVGLILYFFFSPFWPATYQAFGETMRNPVARFYGVEHGVMALIAAAVAHIGFVRVKRAQNDRAKYGLLATTMVIAFVILLWAIPWPGREVGRPLFPTIP